jgi:hypothetical protein
MQIETSAFLVRKEGLDPESFLIPVASFFFQIHI